MDSCSTLLSAAVVDIGINRIRRPRAWGWLGGIKEYHILARINTRKRLQDGSL